MMIFGVMAEVFQKLLKIGVLDDFLKNVVFDDFFKKSGFLTIFRETNPNRGLPP